MAEQEAIQLYETLARSIAQLGSVAVSPRVVGGMDSEIDAAVKEMRRIRERGFQLGAWDEGLVELLREAAITIRDLSRASVPTAGDNIELRRAAEAGIQWRSRVRVHIGDDI